MKAQSESIVSMRSLFKISFPIMIAYLSGYLMLFVDRLFLARYDALALKACTTAGMLGWALTLAPITLVMLSEVFVAQSHGAGRKTEAPRPVWQMIWLTVSSVIGFIVLSYILPNTFYSSPDKSQEHIYLKWLLLTSPSIILTACISAFFIGIGRPGMLKWFSIVGNLINIILDPLLIFGFGGLIPSMGIEGAAIATLVGKTLEAALLFSFFLKKTHRDEFSTHICFIDLKLLKQCLKIGLPPALFTGLEFLAWALFYALVSEVSFEHIFVLSVCDTILMMFLFFGLALEKGVASIAGNLIGSGTRDEIPKLLKSGVKLVFIYTAFVFTFFIFFAGSLMDFFIHPDHAIFMASQENAIATKAHYTSLIQQGLIIIGFYVFFEDLRWILNGILTASGDTLFLMLAGVTSVWLFLIMPTYLLIVQFRLGILYAFLIWVLYSFSLVVITFIRFKQNKWKDAELLSKEYAVNDEVS